MRNYTFKLSNNQSFQQVASDGGLLNDPVELTELQLTPSERAEIVIDFSKIKENEDVKLITDDGTVLLPFQVNDKESKVQKEMLKPENPITISDEIIRKEVSKEIVLFGMMHHVTINGKKFDPNRIDFTQKKGETEVWEEQRQLKRKMMETREDIQKTEDEIVSLEDTFSNLTEEKGGLDRRIEIAQDYFQVENELNELEKEKDVWQRQVSEYERSLQNLVTEIERYKIGR